MKTSTFIKKNIKKAILNLNENKNKDAAKLLSDVFLDKAFGRLNEIYNTEDGPQNNWGKEDKDKDGIDDNDEIDALIKAAGPEKEAGDADDNGIQDEDELDSLLKTVRGGDDDFEEVDFNEDEDEDDELNLDFDDYNDDDFNEDDEFSDLDVEQKPSLSSRNDETQFLSFKTQEEADSAMSVLKSWDVDASVKQNDETGRFVVKFNGDEDLKQEIKSELSMSGF